MKKILVIHGPNLNLLGQREKNIYGDTTLESLNAQLVDVAQKAGCSLETFQSNHEGEIVEQIQNAAQNQVSAIVMNPAAYTHTSVAIRDAIAACVLPVIEVHMSNVYNREEFRHTSLTAPVCRGQISGFGIMSYTLGIQAAVELLTAS